MKKLFSHLGSFILVSIVAVVICFCYDIRDGFLFSMLVALSWFFYGKIQIAFIFMQGHALFALIHLKEKVGLSYHLNYWSLKIFKMPVRNAIILSPLVVLFAAFMFMAFSSNDSQLHEQTVRNLRAFAFIASFSIGVAFSHWAFYWREYFFGSEHDARVKLKDEGDAPEVIEEKIDRLRSMGVFGFN